MELFLSGEFFRSDLNKVYGREFKLPLPHHNDLKYYTFCSHCSSNTCISNRTGLTETVSDSSKPAQTSRESSQIQQKQNFVYKFGIYS